MRGAGGGRKAFCLPAQLQGSSLEEQNQSAVKRTDLRREGNPVRSRAGLEGTVLRRSYYLGGKGRVGGKGFRRHLNELQNVLPLHSPLLVPPMFPRGTK